MTSVRVGRHTISPLAFHLPSSSQYPSNPPRYNEVVNYPRREAWLSGQREKWEQALKDYQGLFCFAIFFHAFIFILQLITLAFVQYSADQVAKLCIPKGVNPLTL